MCVIAQDRVSGRRKIKAQGRDMKYIYIEPMFTYFPLELEHTEIVFEIDFEIVLEKIASRRANK